MDKRKEKLFEYIVYNLMDWYSLQKDKSLEDVFCDNDMSKIKVLKLLFFISAIKYEPLDDEKEQLLDVFQFDAMRYGPVEWDIYTNLHIFSNFKINDRGIRLIDEKESLKKLKDTEKLIENDELKQKVDESLETLKAENNLLIITKPFDLVNISHKWKSWIRAKSLADFNETFRHPMRTGSIFWDIHREGMFEQ